MRATIWAMGLAVLVAGCGKSSEPVGENSAGSVRTTAVGEIVGTVPGPTPTPAIDTTAADDPAGAENAMLDNLVD